jgi:hypothetical protein
MYFEVVAVKYHHRRSSLLSLPGPGPVKKMDFDNRIAATPHVDHDVKNNGDGTTTASTARSFSCDCDSNRLMIKKEENGDEKKEQEVNNSVDDNHPSIEQRVQAVVKKEVEEKIDVPHTLTPKCSIDDNYDDWKNGNWCWLLPANANTNDNPNSNANDNINDNTRQSKRVVTCTNHSVKSEENDANNTTANATNTGITVAVTSTTACINRSYDDADDGNNDVNENKPPPKKKTRHCRSINDIIKEEEEEEDSGYEYKTNNTTTDDIDNGKDNKGDDEGYGSWSEGNWCWVLPLPPAVVDEIETAGPSTATTRPWRVVRNRNTSYQHSCEDDGKCNNEDYNNADNDDGDYLSSAKSNTGKITITYKKWQNEIWNKIFQRLVTYKKEHKSINIPQRYAADPTLGNWVHEQRKIYSKKELSIDRTNRLESVGFVWNALEVQWMEMYSRLVEYKNHNKSTRVPCFYTEDLPLGMWVSTQRRVYNNGNLSKKRFDLLNSINFVWVGRNFSFR